MVYIKPEESGRPEDGGDSSSRFVIHVPGGLPDQDSLNELHLPGTSKSLISDLLNQRASFDPDRVRAAVDFLRGDCQDQGGIVNIENKFYTESRKIADAEIRTKYLLRVMNSAYDRDILFGINFGVHSISLPDNQILSNYLIERIKGDATLKVPEQYEIPRLTLESGQSIRIPRALLGEYSLQLMELVIIGSSETFSVSYRLSESDRTPSVLPPKLIVRDNLSRPGIIKEHSLYPFSFNQTFRATPYSSEADSTEVVLKLDPIWASEQTLRITNQGPKCMALGICKKD